MLQRLELKDVGPSDYMLAEFGARLNVITGDNGLGKSFLLDVAWWALTQSWAGERALPDLRKRRSPVIEYSVPTPGGSIATAFHFVRDRLGWAPDTKPLPPDGLVVYARVDGGFAVFDPARNGTPLEMYVDPDDRGRWRPDAFVFSRDEVWWGLTDKARNIHLCNGLIADWRVWQLEDAREFHALRQALAVLSPEPNERLVPGRARRVDPIDSREIPTLKMPYGEIPVTHASAAAQRILSLAYLLVWALHEHQDAARLYDRPPTREITLLVDEVESHLHPRWQRAILPALLETIQVLSDGYLRAQVICVTHSPLVLASLETRWDAARDRLFTLDLETMNGGPPEASLKTVNWRKLGDVNNWLTSEVFDLRQPRSREAEVILERAREVMRRPGADPTDLAPLLDDLAKVVPETDPIFLRLQSLITRGGASDAT